MADNAVIPLTEDYDFSNLTDLELDIEIDVNQAILDQIDRMITENISKIDLGDDVINREKFLEILDNEKVFQQNKKTVLLVEKEGRE